MGNTFIIEVMWGWGANWGGRGVIVLQMPFILLSML